MAKIPCLRLTGKRKRKGKKRKEKEEKEGEKKERRKKKRSKLVGFTFPGKCRSTRIGYKLLD